MARGGARAGAGRKPGSKTQLTKQALKRAGEGITPLEYMLQILRDESEDKAQRFEAAKAAAPYVHPRLAQTEATVTHKQDVTDLSTAELDALIAAELASGEAGEGSGSGKPH